MSIQTFKRSARLSAACMALIILATLRQQAYEQVGRIAVLKSTAEQLRWNLPDPKQVFLPAGSTHGAYVEIRKIIQSATSEILIVDTYVDGHFGHC